MLTGNEIALLLADWVWQDYARKVPDQEQRKAAFMVASTVSSKVCSCLDNASRPGMCFVFGLRDRGGGGPGGGVGDSAGPGTPTPPPPPGGLRPTVSCRRCCPQEPMVAEGA